jgi:hypothetical protein
MNPGAALSVKDIAGLYKLSVCSFGSQSLGLGITAVLRGANALFMGEKLKVHLHHVITPP